ncbi:MAG: saccharopine dehydrogenase NADP-binding domain-containing protein [Ferruginibacter sp.]|nr:saccharopine dehydrogenase NADP-binding domain-containing protein [Bacteroidota bacterium]MBX2918425.1 saccharopine dehydrogenase NADP-binding domain-containing protein [Ferruginibacter sp.]MCC7379242.1 saccharopine dehydrogenase NADP-binding domain-containing protein [Chitinophagaceae bacterium]
MQIAILGAGMVGRAMAIDLAAKYDVTSFDINHQSLQILSQKNSTIKTIKADLSNYNNYNLLLKDFDYVISAVPGFMGYQCLQAIIKAKKNVVDISFFSENALMLHQLAIENDVTAIVDCGVAPGMSNLILGYYNERMKITSFECMVGGLPKKRIYPFEYKAPFSPIDVLEEYTRPARYVENGKIVTRPALSDAELIDFDKVGTLESFNTDGLRSILFTMPHIANMKEKTLRYPGHIALMQGLIKAGFLSTQTINFKGQQVSPMEFTSTLLFDQWKLGENEEEFTLMQINISDNKKTICYNLYDEYDAATQTSSMSRTTGYTCTAALNMLIEKVFTAKGVFPPELVGKDETCFNFILQYLAERNVNYTRLENKLLN